MFHVSEVRDYEMAVELQSILDKYNTYPQIADILRRCSGFPADIFKEGRRVSGWSGKRKHEVKKHETFSDKICFSQ